MSDTLDDQIEQRLVNYDDPLPKDVEEAAYAEAQRIMIGNGSLRAGFMYGVKWARAGYMAADLEVARWLTDHGIATGHGDTISDMLDQIPLARQSAEEAGMREPAWRTFLPGDIDWLMDHFAKQGWPGASLGQQAADRILAALRTIKGEAK